MLKVKIFTIGKIKEVWLETALKEYELRLKPSLEISWILKDNEKSLEKAILQEDFFVCLDEKGKQFSSSLWSEKLFSLFAQRGSRLTFVIGGADGLSDAVKQKASLLLSLSSMTLTHQMTRLILLEQLYRAIEINKGSPYHK